MLCIHFWKMSTWQKLGTSVAVTVSVTCLCWSLEHAEQLLFSCVSSKVSICNYVTCHMSYVKCLCWFLGHAEQFLFWCLCSRISNCNYVTCHMLHVTCRMSHVTCHMSNAYVDPWDMLNNFCFHVYTQKWVFVIMSHVTFRMSHVTCHIAHVTCHM